MKGLASTIFLVSLFSMTAGALEDDGTPYRALARRVSPAPNAHIPLTVGAYDEHGLKVLKSYMSDVDEADGRRPEADVSSRSCLSFHDRFTNDRVLDIRYALGYFDDSTGAPFVWAGLDWGKSVSLDEGVWMALRSFLMAPCPNSERRLCQFTEITSAAERNRVGETVLSRSIEIHGRSVEVRITLSYASASPFYSRNVSEIRSKQERYTEASNENFFGGIRSADYVFYMGHARNGGGPDFSPPVLLPYGKPDYMGHYRKSFPGRTRMISELKKSSRKDVLLGLFACDSKLHFHKRLLAQNSKQNMILTLGGEGKLHYLDTMMVSFAYLEGLLRGRCGSSLDDFARVTDRERAAYQQYNLK